MNTAEQSAVYAQAIMERYHAERKAILSTRRKP